MPKTKPISFSAYKKQCVSYLWKLHKERRALLDASLENVALGRTLETRTASSSSCVKPQLVGLEDGTVVCFCIKDGVPLTRCDEC